MTEKSIYPLFLKITKNLFAFSLILYGIHIYIQYHFFKNIELFHPIYTIYLFLFLSVLVLFYYLVKAYVQKPDTIFTTFAVGSLLKSAGVVLFFIPLFFKETSNINHTVFNFFIPYFLFVFFEIYLVMSLSKEVK